MKDLKDIEAFLGLVKGKPMQGCSRALKERKNELKKVVRGGLDEEDIFILKRCRG